MNICNEGTKLESPTSKICVTYHLLFRNTNVTSVMLKTIEATSLLEEGKSQQINKKLIPRTRCYSRLRVVAAGGAIVLIATRKK